MKVLICGGRDFYDKYLMWDVLKQWDIKTVIHGGARGADRLAWEWSNEHDTGLHVHPAEWDKYGKAAGHIRNKKMLDVSKPDLVIAFPGGRGTANMVRQAKEAGVEVYEVSDSRKIS